MSSILVLGGAGYIGSHTVYELIAVGENVVVVDVDGTQYDCALTADMNMDSNYVQHVTVTVHHPSDYNGVVFVFGGQTATQNTAYNAIDTSKTFTIADYSDVFIDGQYFFTATDK